MKVIHATSVSPGLGRGKGWLLTDPLAEPASSSGASEPEVEKLRLEAALAKVRSDLRIAAREIGAQMAEEFAEIFRAHELMLESLISSRELSSELAVTGTTAEVAVHNVFRRWEEKFLRIQNPILQTKADDLADLFRKVINALQGRVAVSLAEQIPPGRVLLTPRLLPSDVIGLSRRSVEAIIVEQLGKGSHAALLARERGIPVLAGIPLSAVSTLGVELLVDTVQEKLIVDPDAETLVRFERRLESYKTSLEYCRVLCQQSATTRGGAVVQVLANIGNQETAEDASLSGADGIGLLRMEQLYLGRSALPDSDELFNQLREILRPLQQKPITIRLLDVGGDKVPEFLGTMDDRDPLLGRRGVRLLLAYPELIRRQLKILLKLSAELPVKILVPMVTLASDMSAVRAIFQELIHTESVSSPPPLGAMIETPAAALALEELSPFCDFFSIGSNDLTQYTLAAARENPEVDDYYQDAHPAVLRLLGMIIESAGEKPVTLCGELAGKDEVIPKLVAMGLRALSVAPLQIPAIKQQIRTLL